MSDIEALFSAVRRRTQEMRRHHGLNSAIRTLGTTTLRDYANAPLAVRHVVKDRVSYMLVKEILRVFYTEPHVATAGTFKRGIVQSGLSSRGRASTLIDFMLGRGLLVRPPGGDAGVLAPGGDLVAYYHAMLRNGIAALRALDSEIAARVDVTDDALFRGHLLVSAEVAQQMPEFTYGAGPSQLALFFDRDAGLLVLYAILEAMDGGEQLSISGVARRAGVSRPHILKMLADLHAQELAVWDRDHRRIRFTQELRDQVESFFTGLLALHEAYLTRAELRLRSSIRACGS